MALSSDEMRIAARNAIENLEKWLRRLIHTEYTKVFGSDYPGARIGGNNFVFPKDIRAKLQKLRYENPNIPPLNSTTLDELCAIASKNHLWHIVKPALTNAFPLGSEMARVSLSRLLPVRNSLSHANPISELDYYYAVSTSLVTVESIRNFYREEGKERMFNVPEIRSILTWYGEKFDLSSRPLGAANFEVIDLRKSEASVCAPGDKIWLEVEVDAPDGPDSYKLLANFGTRGVQISNNRFEVELENRDVGDLSVVVFNVISLKDWHRYKLYDDQVKVRMRVMPP